MLDQDNSPTPMHEPLDPNTPAFEPDKLAVKFTSREEAQRILQQLQEEKDLRYTETFPDETEGELAHHYVLTVKPDDLRPLLGALAQNRDVVFAERIPQRHLM